MDFFNYVLEKKLVFLIISLIINVIFISISGFLFWNLWTYENSLSNNLNNIDNNVEVEETSSKIYVDIKGEVKNPGVYEVNDENIINDVIVLAGGFTKSAYKNNINLSKKVSNELVIYVYSNSEYKKINENEIKIEECVCPDYDITNCIENGSSEIINNINNIETNEENNIIEENTSKLININTASLDELMTLSGIGESKAKAIIEYRSKNKFNTIEDIKNVSGIGESAFEKIKEYITV